MKITKETMYFSMAISGLICGGVGSLLGPIGTMIGTLFGMFITGYVMTKIKQSQNRKARIQQEKTNPSINDNIVIESSTKGMNRTFTNINTNTNNTHHISIQAENKPTIQREESDLRSVLREVNDAINEELLIALKILQYSKKLCTLFFHPEKKEIPLQNMADVKVGNKRTFK